MVPARRSPTPVRSTFPFIPEDKAGSPDEPRGTAPGMPIDVFDPPVPARVTDVGVPTIVTPAAAGPPIAGGSYRTPAPDAGTSQPLPSATTALEIPVQGQRSTQPGYSPAGQKLAEPVKPTPKRTPKRSAKVTKTPSPPAPAVQAASVQRGRPPKRSLLDLPLSLHIVLGLALGLAVVGGYWLFQQLGGPSLLR
jgi:hypothetical protein